MKGDIIWDIGEGHRNEIHYNPQSTILVTCGFGNISSGRMEFWNLLTRKEISQFCVPHTTHFGWAPDGQHIWFVLGFFFGNFLGNMEKFFLKIVKKLVS